MKRSRFSSDINGNMVMVRDVNINSLPMVVANDTTFGEGEMEVVKEETVTLVEKGYKGSWDGSQISMPDQPITPAPVNMEKDMMG